MPAQGIHPARGRGVAPRPTHLEGRKEGGGGAKASAHSALCQHLLKDRVMEGPRRYRLFMVGPMLGKIVTLYQFCCSGGTQREAWNAAWLWEGLTR